MGAPAAPVNLTATAVSPTKIGLSWHNPEAFDDVIFVERKPGGGGWAALATINGTDESYNDTSCGDGTLYSYRVRGRNDTGEGYEYSGYSNEADAITPLPAPTGLKGTSNAAGTAITLTWNDNSQHEDSFKIFQGAALIHTTAANVESYPVTGLTPGHTYTFSVKAYNAVAGYSSASSGDIGTEEPIVPIITDPPPNKPSGLTATPLTTTSVRLNWTDNSNNEVDFHIEKSSTSATEGFSETAPPTVGANITTYTATGLDSAAQYWFRVRAHNAVGYSGYSNVATTTSYAEIAPPTNVIATPTSAVLAEITFDDNSTLEDDHHYYVKDGAGDWPAEGAATGTVAPNRTYFTVSMEAGHTYLIRLKAHQAASYSGYSNEAAYAPLTVPPAPTNLSLSEYQDTWARLTWTPTTGEVGYSIEQSIISDVAGFAEVMRICDGIGSMKVPWLTASTHYWWRIRAYSGAGYSGYTSVVDVITRAAYLPSKFEKLILKSKPKLVFLVEANPLMELMGWINTSGVTYEAAFDEAGAALDAVYENGLALKVRTSIVTVEATAGTYWHDTVNKLVYVHTTGGDSPINALITGSLRLYFTTWQEGKTIYNGNNYLPLVAADGIPDISQIIQPYYEGTFAVSSGTVSFINGKVRKAFYFDRRYARYLWLNRKVKFLAGGTDFTYTQFAHINTGSINAVTIDSRRMSLDLRDFRDGLHRDLPAEKYSLDIYPRMDVNRMDAERPFGFGAITRAIPVYVDLTNHVFEFHYGRVKSVSVTQNGVPLVENTNYFVDYQRGRVTLARGLAYVDSDILLVDFTGCVNPADEANVTGAEIFLYICRTWLGCSLADMDLDAIYATKYEKPTALSLYLRTTQSSEEIIRTIEQSSQAYTMQDAEGRLGIRGEQATPASGAPYVWGLHVFDFTSKKGPEQLYSAINIYYNENPLNDIYALAQTPRPIITWKYGINKCLDIYVALAGNSDAINLGIAIAKMMERQQITFTVPRVLYTCLPGDVIYFNRSRFPSLSGTAANLPVRILGISKLISSGKTAITAEVV